jgi:hypothetical protein
MILSTDTAKIASGVTRFNFHQIVNRDHPDNTKQIELMLVIGIFKQ